MVELSGLTAIVRLEEVSRHRLSRMNVRRWLCASCDRVEFRGSRIPRKRLTAHSFLILPCDLPERERRYRMFRTRVNETLLTTTPLS